MKFLLILVSFFAQAQAQAQAAELTVERPLYLLEGPKLFAHTLACRLSVYGGDMEFEYAFLLPREFFMEESLVVDLTAGKVTHYRGDMDYTQVPGEFYLETDFTGNLVEELSTRRKNYRLSDRSQSLILDLSVERLGGMDARAQHNPYLAVTTIYDRGASYTSTAEIPVDVAQQRISGGFFVQSTVRTADSWVEADLGCSSLSEASQANFAKEVAGQF